MAAPVHAKLMDMTRPRGAHLLQLDGFATRFELQQLLLTEADRAAGSRAQIHFDELPVASREAVARIFRQELFAMPFGRGLAVGRSTAITAWHQAPPLRLVPLQPEDPDPWPVRLATWRWTSQQSGGATLATGVAMYLQSGAPLGPQENSGDRVQVVHAVELRERGGVCESIAEAVFGPEANAALTGTILFLVRRALGPALQVCAARSAIPA